MIDRAGVSAADEPWPAAGHAWFVVIVLALANAVSFVDRLILSLLVPDLKSDLLLSDTQISLLQGFAFALFYCLMGLPIARLADSKNRRTIIMTGVALWSLMTATCGLARGFWHIFIARVGVGVGEATLSPSAYSMLADYFPPKKLALPIGIFSAGVTGGMGLSLLAGAAAIQAVAAMGAVDVPIFGALGGWRLVFVFVGLLGILVIALMAFVREPKRRDGARPGAVSLAEVRRHLLANWRLYFLVMGGYGATSVSAYGIVTWTPAFYMRSFGLTPSEAGYLMGLVALVGGISGAASGGLAADWLARRGDDNAKLRVLLVSCIALWPVGVLAPLMPSLAGAASVVFFTFFFGTAASGPAGSFVQVVTPNRMRAQFGALYQLALNLIGLGLGPTAVALLTDYAFRDEMMVRYAISTVAFLVNPFAILFVWLGFRLYPKVRHNLPAAAAI